jgi:hypothetical protein
MVDDCLENLLFELRDRHVLVIGVLLVLDLKPVLSCC